MIDPMDLEVEAIRLDTQAVELAEQRPDDACAMAVAATELRHRAWRLRRALRRRAMIRVVTR